MFKTVYFGILISIVLMVSYGSHRHTGKFDFNAAPEEVGNTPEKNDQMHRLPRFIRFIGTHTVYNKVDAVKI